MTATQADVEWVYGRPLRKGMRVGVAVDEFCRGKLELVWWGFYRCSC